MNASDDDFVRELYNDTEPNSASCLLLKNILLPFLKSKSTQT